MAGLSGIWSIMSVGNNLRKAYNYMKRNGIKSTFYASLERLDMGKVPYSYTDISMEEEKRQKEAVFKEKPCFSIVVPMYETNEGFAIEMIASVLNQTYSKLELILVDASKSDKVEKVVATIKDARVKYIRIKSNDGISANTNAGIDAACGDYIGLLDHDDLLTKDALYEMAVKINCGKEEGIEYGFIYSNEDKCDSNAEKFYEPHFKPDFNIDLLLSNNYICHFTVVESGLMKKLKLRSDFDGAQDHDLVLRAYANIGYKHPGHVDKVLYHWRCHEDSTAYNPQSKLYAYEAGRMAIFDYLKTVGIEASVIDTEHNGFFRVVYGAKEGDKIETVPQEIFKYRYDLGIIGGPLTKGNKIIGGIIDDTRTCPLDGQNIHYSGYMHRNHLQQDVIAVDIRSMYIRSELLSIFEKVLAKDGTDEILNPELINDKNPVINIGKYLKNIEDADDNMIMDLSYDICTQARLEGYKIMYEPNLK